METLHLEIIASIKLYCAIFNNYHSIKLECTTFTFSAIRGYKIIIGNYYLIRVSMS